MSELTNTLPPSPMALIAAGALSAVREEVKAHPELIDQPTYFAGGTLLHFAAAESSPEMVGLLLELGFSADMPGAYYGDTPLQAACANGRTQNAALLIAHGARLDGEHSYTSPLFAAVVNGHIGTVELLVIRGADPLRRHTLESGHCVDAEGFARLKEQLACAQLLRRLTTPAGTA